MVILSFLKANKKIREKKKEILENGSILKEKYVYLSEEDLNNLNNASLDRKKLLESKSNYILISNSIFIGFLANIVDKSETIVEGIFICLIFVLLIVSVIMILHMLIEKQKIYQKQVNYNREKKSIRKIHLSACYELNNYSNLIRNNYLVMSYNLLIFAIICIMVLMFYKVLIPKNSNPNGITIYNNYIKTNAK